MKKIIGVIKVFCVLYTIKLILLAVSQIKHLINFDHKVPKKLAFDIRIFDDVTETEYTISSILICTGILWLIFINYRFFRVIMNFEKDYIFTKKNVLSLKQIAQSILLFLAVIMTIDLYFELSHYLNISEYSYSIARKIGITIGFLLAFVPLKGLSIIIVVLFILLMAKLLENGHILKSENDLTI